MRRDTSHDSAHTTGDARHSTSVTHLNQSIKITDTPQADARHIYLARTESDAATQAPAQRKGNTRRALRRARVASCFSLDWAQRPRTRAAHLRLSTEADGGVDCRRVRKSQGLALQDARLLDDELSLLVFLTAGQHVRALAVGAGDAARGRAGSGTSGGTYLLSKASRYFHPSRAVHAVQKMSETECKPVIRTRSSFGPSMTLVAVVKRKARPWRPWNDLETSCSCVATATRAVPATPSSCEKGDRRKSRRAHVYWGRCGRTVRSAGRARVDLVARQPCGRGRHGSRPACPPRPREERAVRKGEDCFRREGGREPRELKGGPTASGG